MSTIHHKEHGEIKVGDRVHVSYAGNEGVMEVVDIHVDPRTHSGGWLDVKRPEWERPTSVYLDEVTAVERT